MQINSNFNLPPRGIDPNAYAQQYATQNNISVDEAKTQLESKYGAPQAKDESLFTANNIPSLSSGALSLDDLDGLSDGENADLSFSGVLKEFLSLFKGGNESSNASDKRQNPDDIAQEYADKHNITLEEAKEELKSKYGEPNQQ